VASRVPVGYIVPRRQLRHTMEKETRKFKSQKPRVDHVIANVV
jgi:hypothetical protein